MARQKSPGTSSGYVTLHCRGDEYGAVLAPGMASGSGSRSASLGLPLADPLKMGSTVSWATDQTFNVLVSFDTFNFRGKSQSPENRQDLDGASPKTRWAFASTPPWLPGTGLTFSLGPDPPQCPGPFCLPWGPEETW